MHAPKGQVWMCTDCRRKATCLYELIDDEYFLNLKRLKRKKKPCIINVQLVYEATVVMDQTGAVDTAQIVRSS